MVAAAIVAMTLGSVLHAVSEGAARARALEARREALLVARSELAAVGSSIPLRPGQTTGATGALDWRVMVAAYGGGETSAVGQVWEVAVFVREPTGGADLVSLRTLRAGPAAG
jgi:general secretion pathway protein I